MLKEKLSKIFKDDGNNKKKTENLVFLLVILIITVVAINVIWRDEETPKSTTNNTSKQLAVNESKSMNVELTLEEKLENILSKIAGVGNVDVLITYNETEQILPIYNTEDKTSVINETDSGRWNKSYTRK